MMMTVSFRITVKSLVVVMTLLAVAHLKFALGYPDGADVSSCETMIPNHGVGLRPQNLPSPFTVTLSRTSVNGYEFVDVTLTNTTNTTKFKGFLIQVRRPGGNIAMGEFTDNNRLVSKPGTMNVRTMNCFGKSRSSTTQTSSNLKSSVTTRWIAPNDAGDYQVYYTVVQDKATFWTHLSHGEKIHVLKNVTAVTQDESSKENEGLLKRLRQMYKNCGDGLTKGCFGVPKNCVNEFAMSSKQPKTCDMLVTWRKTDTNDNEFELTGKSETGANHDLGYVAVGLSIDEGMGDDSVVGCLFWGNDSHRPSINRYYNTLNPKSSVKHKDSNLGLNAISATNIGGNIFCKFHQLNHKIREISVDFDSQKYYYMLSKGPSFLDESIGRHTISDKGVSSVAVLISDYVKIQYLQDLWLVEVHGSLMLFAWLVFASTGMFTARYYKQTHVERQLLGRPFWFTVHVTCVSVTAVLSVAGVSFIIYKKKGFDLTSTHSILGITLFVLAIPQWIIPIFRNYPCAPRRIIFTWTHFLGATILHTIAYVCIFLACNLDLADLNSDFRWTICVAAAILFTLVMHVVMTYHTHWANLKMEVDPELQPRNWRVWIIGPLRSNGVFGEAPGSRFRYCVLIFYILGVTLISTILTCLIFHIF